MTDPKIPAPEPCAHMMPSDLKKFETAETTAHAYSVAVGNAKERSAPLITLEAAETYAAAREAAAVAAERERCAKLCEGMHPEDKPSDYAWTIRTEWADDSRSG